MRRALLVALTAAALLAPAAAQAAPNRDEVIDAYRHALEDEAVGAGWTGSTSTCDVGSESQASLDATLRTINSLRSLAGVGPVTFDQTFNHQALSAALMMKAKDDLSHNPDPSWPCYSNEGALGAGSSNLFLGLSGAAAMVGFVDDSGVDSLGHRRWLINPGATVFGSGSTGSTNALKVIGGPVIPVAPETKVAWPPAGYVPWPWVFDTWSVALGGDLDSDQYGIDNAQVHVTLDGDPLEVSNVRALEDGFGTGRTLSWQVAVPSSATGADHELKVAIDGVVRGTAQYPVSYTVNAVHIPNEAACNAAKNRLAKAKDKLRKLRQQHASKQRIKKAKKKVAKAKDAVTASC